MTSYVLIEGRFVADTGYERGRMILYPEDEWRNRKALLRRSHVRFQVLLMASTLFMPLTILFGLIFKPEAGEDPFIIGLLFLYLGMFSALFAFSVHLNKEFDGYPLMGLYELGFHYYESFYPYDEIDKVEIEKGRLMFWYTHQSGNHPHDLGSEKRIMTILGLEGINELKRRIQYPRSPE